MALGIKALLSRKSALSADLIRQSVLEFGWQNVTSAMTKEYATVIRQHQMASYPQDLS
jgi:hypothetical protein